MVKATVTGKGDLVGLVIDPSAVDPDDVEMLQDLVVTAVSEAIREARETRGPEDGRAHRRPPHPRSRLTARA